MISYHRVGTSSESNAFATKTRPMQNRSALAGTSTACLFGSLHDGCFCSDYAALHRPSFGFVIDFVVRWRSEADENPRNTRKQISALLTGHWHKTKRNGIKNLVDTQVASMTNSRCLALRYSILTKPEGRTFAVRKLEMGAIDIATTTKYLGSETQIGCGTCIISRVCCVHGSGE